MDALQELHNELYHAQRTESVEVQLECIGKARLLLARYRGSLGAPGAATAAHEQEAHQRIYDLLLGGDGQAHKEARKYLERNAPELAALLAQPAPVQQDEIGRKAFARYIKDCDECAIVPDVAGAFHWAWTHAALVQPGQQLVPVEPTDDMEAAAENDYEDTGATFPDWKSAYRAMLKAAAEPWMEQEAKYEAQMRETHAAQQPDDTPLKTGEGDAL